MAETIGGSGRGCGACGGLLSPRPEQARETRRSDDDRHGNPTAEQLEAEVAFGRSIEWTRKKRDLIERLLVAPQSALVLRPAIRKIEDGPRENAMRHPAQVRDAVGVPAPALRPHSWCLAAVTLAWLLRLEVNHGLPASSKGKSNPLTRNPP